MFYENFQKLCKKEHTSPSAVAMSLGYSNATAAKWKRGSMPKDSTLQKIADYFGVTVEELLQDNSASPARNVAANIKNSAIIQGNSGNNVSATVGVPVSSEQPSDASELEILRIYRSLSVLEKAKFIQMAFEFDKKGQ